MLRSRDGWYESLRCYRKCVSHQQTTVNKKDFLCVSYRVYPAHEIIQFWALSSIHARVGVLFKYSNLHDWSPFFIWSTMKSKKFRHFITSLTKWCIEVQEITFHYVVNKMTYCLNTILRWLFSSTHLPLFPHFLILVKRKTQKEVNDSRVTGYRCLLLFDIEVLQSIIGFLGAGGGRSEMIKWE